MKRNLGHYVVVTVIVVNSEGKYLISKRADWEKNFPGKWTVPGGKLEVLDYVLKKKDTAHHWYNTFEGLAEREIMEEVGLEIGNVGYVTSLTFIREDEVPVLIVSLYAEAKGENVKLGKSMTDFAWVSLEEAKNYDLIDGIYEEIEILDRKLKGGERIGDVAEKWEKKGDEKKAMRDVTLVLPLRNGRILLGMKKRGFGEGKINGFGGKLNEGESIEEGAVRELSEEIGIKVSVESLKKVGELAFSFPHAKDKDWDQKVHVFLVRDWDGVPMESEEMSCDWYDIDELPVNKMWDADKDWMPMVLDGRKVKGTFAFNEDNSTIAESEIVDLD
jgi:8-oxo-dGTP pyrophosphatase MutT (NUDIX family)